MASARRASAASGWAISASPYSNVPHLPQTHGGATRFESKTATASHRATGSGKWIAKPALTYARLLRGSPMLAPSLLHNISFAGDGRRRPSP